MEVWQCTNLVSVIVIADVSQSWDPIITSTDLELGFFRTGNKDQEVPYRLFSSFSFCTWRNGGTENWSTLPPFILVSELRLETRPLNS